VSKLILYTDGGSRGNPGPAAAAYVLKDIFGKIISGKGIFIANATNNFAEYSGVVYGLKAAQDAGATQIELVSDSELMVKQIHGHYKVKSENLRDLYCQTMDLLSSFQSWQARHVLREKNIEADKLANQAMDAKGDVEFESSRTVGGIKPIRLGVLISGGGRTLLNLDQQIKSRKLSAEVAVVICSRKEIKGVELAKQLGFDPQIIRVKDYPDIEQFSGKIAETLDIAKVDLVIQAGWLCLWNIPKQYEGRVMNIHPALLPSFGGQGMWGHHVHEAVLKAGCKVSGCTVHFCTNEYDKGPIVAQRGCRVMENDTPDTLAARVFELECQVYPEAIQLFAEGRLSIVDDIVRINK
jgi:formyltetrahydrofolate-dependent phosphoribosylglycinamide formyltransferase